MEDDSAELRRTAAVRNSAEQRETASVEARRRNASKACAAAAAARAQHKADAVAANAHSRLHVIPPYIQQGIREDLASVKRMLAGAPIASDLEPVDRSFRGRIAYQAAHRAKVFAWERQRAAARAAARAEGQRGGRQAHPGARL